MPELNINMVNIKQLNIDFVRRSKRLLLADVTAVSMILGWCAMLFSAGLIFADHTGGAYDFMMKFMTVQHWAILFLIYGLAKFILVFWELPRVYVYFSGVLGLIAWSHVLMSFTSAQRLLSPTDVMLAFLIMAEVWVSAYIASNVAVKIATGTHWRSRRKGDLG
jgi:small-conductance mechanosensitive channel